MKKRTNGKMTNMLLEFRAMSEHRLAELAAERFAEIQQNAGVVQEAEGSVTIVVVCDENGFIIEAFDEMIFLSKFNRLPEIDADYRMVLGPNAVPRELGLFTITFAGLKDGDIFKMTHKVWLVPKT